MIVLRFSEGDGKALESFENYFIWECQNNVSSYGKAPMSHFMLKRQDIWFVLLCLDEMIL